MRKSKTIIHRILLCCSIFITSFSVNAQEEEIEFLKWLQNIIKIFHGMTDEESSASRRSFEELTGYKWYLLREEVSDDDEIKKSNETLKKIADQIKANESNDYIIVKAEIRSQGTENVTADLSFEHKGSGISDKELKKLVNEIQEEYFSQTFVNFFDLGTELLKTELELQFRILEEMGLDPNGWEPEFNYFVSDDDAWLRQPAPPYAFVDPTAVIDQGQQVALLDKFETGDAEVAKMQVKEDKAIQHTTFTNISEVKEFKKERTYTLKVDYHPLILPYSQTLSETKLKKGDKVIVDKFCGNYLKVKTENEGYEGTWIEKNVAEGENFIFIEIERKKHNDNRTIGTISVDNGSKKGFTLELQKGDENECTSKCTDEKKAQNNCYRIKAGTYDFSITSTSSNPKFINKSLRLFDVPGRQGILIHRGVNARIWSYGCILAMRNDPSGDADDSKAKNRANSVTDSENFCGELVNYINDREREIIETLGYEDIIKRVIISENSEIKD